MKRILFTLLIFVFAQNAFGQGINFQGVARSANGTILANQKISLKLSIITGSNTSTPDYIETRSVATNSQGIFSIVVGDTATISTIGNYASISWKTSNKFLKVEMDPNNGINFISMGTTPLQFVPFSYYSNGVDAENVAGVMPVKSGGTGATTASAARTNLGLAIGTNVQAPLVAGTDYLVPTGSAASLTNFPTFNQNTTGNAATATKLAVTKNINGVAFDGSADIIITATADAGTLTGATLKSTVTGSSLTSVGILSGGSVPYSLLTGTVPIFNQNTTGNAATATNAATAGNITATSNTTLTSLPNLATVGTLSAGAVPYSLLTGTAPIWNQNTTGNAATATNAATAGNITATSNTTLTSLPNLATVGTIASLTTGSITNSGKVMVGAIVDPGGIPSAILEANSTTQGFLPPRMTLAQRNAIPNPVDGLMIFCSDNFGGEIEVYNSGRWVNMNGRISNSTLSIGDYYQGGKIAHILVSGETGYDANTQHGLIASVNDLIYFIRWYKGSYTTTGATGTAIGTGLSNTNAIIASQGELATSYAAGVARAYNGGGYTDWYLPSRDELSKLYLNKTLIAGFPAERSYWSSSEHSNGAAYRLESFFGGNSEINKDNTCYVRAIRAF